MIKRTYYEKIFNEFIKEKSMVLISGPRQVGKTTFAKNIAKNYSHSTYFNYDIPNNKLLIEQDPTFFIKSNKKKGENPLIIFDEIHKKNDWKNYLKGVFDGYSNNFNFLVTGSGRLDINLKKGDALSGRFLYYQIFPITIGELKSTKIGNSLNNLILDVPKEKKENYEIWDILLQVGGFPEPYIKGKTVSYNRWARVYHSRIIQDDIRDELAIKQINSMQTLYHYLNECIGSPFSANNAAHIIKTSHNTIISWMNIFEKFFLIFKILPYNKKLSRALLKEPKYYFFDYCRINNLSIRFENMVALELLRAVNSWSHYGLGEYDLKYIRTKDGEEVDFIITKNEKPLLLIEAKLNEAKISKSLHKFQNQLNVPIIQLVNKKGVNKLYKEKNNTILITSAPNWLALLN